MAGQVEGDQTDGALDRVAVDFDATVIENGVRASQRESA